MRYVWSAAGVVLSGVALYYFVAFLPGDLLTQVFAHRGVFLAGAAVMVPAYVIRAYKSWLILNEPVSRTGPVAGSLYASIALNNVLPFRLGDVLRLFYLRTILGIGLARATAALLIERVIDLLVILLLFVLAAGVILRGEVYDVLSEVVGRLPAGYLLAAAAVALGMLAVLVSFRRLAYRFVWPILAQIDPTWLRAGKLVLAAVLQWLLEIIALSMVASALLPDVPTGQAILSAFMSNLSTLIPSAPGYVGTFEVAGILPFKLMSGQFSEIQALYVLLYHLVIWAFSTGLGFVAGLWLLFMRWQTQPRRRLSGQL